MSNNSNLVRAKNKKDDEFYTLYKDVENELKHYHSYLKGKSVYLPCDNPKYSMFYKYLYDNFDKIGLSRLVCTFLGTEKDKATVSIVESNSPDITTKELNNNGSFDSEECIYYLNNCDIVITNPPFSLAKTLIPLIINHNKKMIILGNINMSKYKEVFPFIKENKLWLGYGTGTYHFLIPTNTNMKNTYVASDGLLYAKLGNICWYTNIDIDRRHKPLLNENRASSEVFNKYDSYDAIDVNSVKKIPLDYNGKMGVPITFLQYHCIDQYEIIGELNHGSDNKYDYAKPTINGKELFPRIIIKKKDTYS